MIYVFLADGFEETEALTTVDILRRAELDVVTVGVTGKQVTGSHNITVIADIEAKDVTTDDMEAAVLPGGMPGTLNLEKSPIVKACVKYCFDNNLLICAICAAPSILGHMGILKGKKATCFPGFESELDAAEYTGDFAVDDGNVITGKGAGATILFALKAVEKLKDKQTASKIKAALQCP